MNDWLVETAPDVPRADLPKPFLGGRVRLRWVRLAVGASLILVPLLALSLMISIASRTSGDDAPAAEVSRTRPVATAAVTNWLVGQPPPLPGGGQLLTWDGEKPLPRAEDEQGTQEVPVDMAVHTFTAMAGSGALYTVSVTTATSPELGTVTLGEPAMVPVAPSDTRSAPDPWQTLEPASPGENVHTAIETWATAYSSGDPAKLLQATADGDNNHSYVPLVGVNFLEVGVGTAGAVWGTTNPEAQETPPEMVVRVDITMLWGEVPEDHDKTEDVAKASFDVLVQRTDTASPVVVAWGGAGSGEILTPYMNAVKGRTVTAETPGSNPTPTSSESPEGNPSAKPDEDQGEGR